MALAVYVQINKRRQDSMVSYQKDEINDVLSRIGLKNLTDKDEGYKRIKRGKGFAYYDCKKTLIKCSKIKNRLQSIAIPPSYDDVWYCLHEDGYIQATGHDQNGKKQYFYHEAWETYRESRKFAHMSNVANCLPTLRRKIRDDLKDKGDNKTFILACMARLLDITGMRVGNLISSKERDTYGLTTLQKKHIHVRDDNSLELHYTGKGNVEITRKVSDNFLVTLLEDIIEEHDIWLFDYTDENGDTYKASPSMLNAYLKENASCENLTAKDLRTWRFSVIFLKEALKQYRNENKVTLTSVLEIISEITGNTPAILKKSYIHPGLLEIVKSEDWRKIKIDVATDVADLRKHEILFKQYLDTRHAAIHTSAINI